MFVVVDLDTDEDECPSSFTGPFASYEEAAHHGALWLACSAVFEVSPPPPLDASDLESEHLVETIAEAVRRFQLSSVGTAAFPLEPRDAAALFSASDRREFARELVALIDPS